TSCPSRCAVASPTSGAGASTSGDTGVDGPTRAPRPIWAGPPGRHGTGLLSLRGPTMTRPRSRSRPRRPGGDVRRDIAAQHGLGVDGLVEARQDEPGRKLAADLVAEGVPELQGPALLDQPGALLLGRAVEVRVGDAMDHPELAQHQGDVVEQVLHGVHE